MFIRKKEYEELKEYKDKCRELEWKVRDFEAKLEKYELGEHVCDALCEGCQNLIESTEVDYSSYIIRNYTVRKCALNRKCKDYKAKDNINKGLTEAADIHDIACELKGV